jgi:hypothetical protein
MKILWAVCESKQEESRLAHAMVPLNFNANYSISHEFPLVAVVLSTCCQVGIDLVPAVSPWLMKHCRLADEFGRFRLDEVDVGCWSRISLEWAVKEAFLKLRWLDIAKVADVKLEAGSVWYGGRVQELRIERVELGAPGGHTGTAVIVAEMCGCDVSVEFLPLRQ